MQPVPSPTSPETSVSIRFHPAVLETARSAADAGLKSLPRRGAEIGGLLITSSPGDPPESFEDAALVSSEYRYGPGYHLSPRDIALLTATAAKVGHGRRVAGFFRSCTAEAFVPSPNDRDVLRDELPGCRVLLLLKPFPDGHTVARVFQLRNGVWDQTAEFPIPPERQAPRPARVRTMPKPTLTLPVEVPPTVAKKPHQFRSLWIYSLLGCLLLIFAIAFLGPRMPETTSLGLNVNPEGDVLRVTWNRNASVIRSGKDGVLRIDEGGQRQDVALSPGQLSSGAVLYRSNARDITFRLAVNGGSHAEETVRFVTGGAPAAPVPAVVSGTTPATAPVSSTPVPAAPVRVKTAEVRTVNRPAPAPEKREKKEVVARPAPQPQEKTADRAAQVITPPSAQPIQDTATVAKPPEQPVSLPPVTPQAAQNTQPPPTRPQAPVVQEKTWEPIKSVMHYFNDPAVIRPTPVKEVQPKIKSVHGQPMQVRVLVAVDSRGGVTGAEALERSGDPELVAAAVGAARKWRFEPARDHGKNVAATYTITFRFPSDHR